MCLRIIYRKDNYCLMKLCKVVYEMCRFSNQFSEWIRAPRSTSLAPAAAAGGWMSGWRTGRRCWWVREKRSKVRNAASTRSRPWLLMSVQSSRDTTFVDIAKSRNHAINWFAWNEPDRDSESANPPALQVQYIRANASLFIRADKKSQVKTMFGFGYSWFIGPARTQKQLYQNPNIV